MKIRLNITPKLSLIFLLFAALLLAVVSTLAYTSGHSALEAATVAELFSVAIEKQAALNAWIAETETHAVALSTSPYLQENATALLAARLAGDQAEIQAAHDRLIAELQVWAGASRDYLGWMILDPQTGQIIAATNPGDEGKFREDQPFFINGKSGPYLQNLYYSPSIQGTLMTFSAPIRSDAGVLVGVLAGNLDLENINRIILRRTGLRQSDDAFLVNTSNLFVTRPRLLTDPVALQAGVNTEAVNRCLERTSGVVTEPDYRGVPSMIVYRWLPERQLCLIVKMNQAEALAPVLVLRNRIFLISILALLMAGALAYGLARTITRPVLQLVKAAEEIGAGHLDHHIKVRPGDEIGQLGAAFVQMAGNLQEILVSRDDLLSEVAERKQVETALRDSQAQVTGIFNSAMDAIITVDEKQKIIIFNPSAEQMFGCPASEAIGQTLDRFLPDYVRKKHRKYLRGFGQSNSTKRSMKTPALALTCLRADGETFPSEVSISQLEIGGKKLYTAIVRDITERKRAEEKLTVSEVRYRRLFEAARDGILILDAETGVIIDVNPFLIGMLGSSHEEICGKELWELGFFKDIAANKANFLELQQREYIRYEDLPLETADGRKFHVEFVSNVYQVNHHKVIQCNIRDITERKRAEQALRESEERLRLAILAGRMGTWDRNFISGQLNWSVECKAMFGLAPEIEMNDERFMHALHPEDRTPTDMAVRGALEKQTDFDGEYRVIWPDGTLHWIAAHGQGYYNETGQPIRMTGITFDITERKQAEQALQEYSTQLETEVEKRTRELRDAQEQLVRQERLATLGQVAGSIGHELRNPLGVISNAVYYLKMSQPDVNDTIKEYLDIIANEARTSDKIVTDLLDFSRAKSVDRESVNVAEVVRLTLERFPAPPPVEVILDLPADLPSLYADRHHVVQILGNLVINACQAMQTGGKLTLSASLDGDMIKLVVRDTGSGISSENMAKLFEPLFTTKSKGIGLGLAVSRKLVEINGGRIEVQSEPGQGSTFILYLPVYGS